MTIPLDEEITDSPLSMCFFTGTYGSGFLFIKPQQRIEVDCNADEFPPKASYSQRCKGRIFFDRAYGSGQGQA
jgi:hypothetical protein